MGFFKFSSPVTLLDATAYTLRLISSTTNPVTVYRNATSNNWSRALITTTSSFLATNDQLIIAGYYTGTGGAGSDVTVTIDQTGTPLQVGTTGLLQSISIASRGKLKPGNSAGTAYTMKHRGLCQVRGGTLELGTSSSRLDSTSSFTWTADCVAAGDSGWSFHSGVVDMYGANNKAKWTTLEANVTGGASKQITVASTTGFAVGDTVYLTSTNPTIRTQDDTTTVVSIDSSTTMTLTNLSTSHTGTNDSNGDRRCRVVNCTRNITLQGNSTSLGSYIDINSSAAVNMSYIALWYMGSTSATAGKRGIDIRHGTGGTTNLQYCVQYAGGTTNGIHYNMTPAAAATSITIQHCTSVLSGNTAVNFNTAGANATTIEYCLIAGMRSSSAAAVVINGANQIFRNCEIVAHQGTSGNAAALSITADNTNSLPVTGDLSNNYIAFSYWAVTINSNTASRAYVIDNLMIVESVAGFYAGLLGGYSYKQRQVLNNMTVYGGGSVLPPVSVFGYGPFDFIGCTFVVGAGSWTRFLNMNNNGYINDVRFINCAIGGNSQVMAATTSVFGGTVRFINCTGMPSTVQGLVASTETPYLFEDAVFSSQKHNGTNDLHRSVIKCGYVETDTTIVDSATRSVRLTPTNASVKTGSAMVWRIRVDGGATITPSVKLRKSVVGDGTAYNGNQPRLVIKRNDAVGISSDTVLATATSASDGAWETISGTSATFSDEGEVLLCVDCDGTTGWINIQSITVGTKTNDMTYWNDGFPAQYLTQSTSSGSGSFSYGVS